MKIFSGSAERKPLPKTENPNREPSMEKSLEGIKRRLEEMDFSGDEGLVSKEALKNSLADIEDLLIGSEEEGFNRFEIAYQGLTELEKFFDGVDDLGIASLKEQIAETCLGETGKPLEEYLSGIDLDQARDQLMKGVSEEVPSAADVALAEDYFWQQNLDRQFLRQVMEPGSGYRKLAKKVRDFFERVGLDLDERFSQGILRILGDKKVFSRLATATSVGLILSGCAIQGMPNINPLEKGVADGADSNPDGGADVDGADSMSGSEILKIENVLGIVYGLNLDALNSDELSFLNNMAPDILPYLDDPKLFCRIFELIEEGKLDFENVEVYFEHFAEHLPGDKLEDFIAMINQKDQNFFKAYKYLGEIGRLFENISPDSEVLKEFLLKCAGQMIVRFDLFKKIVAFMGPEFAQKMIFEMKESPFCKYEPKFYFEFYSHVDFILDAHYVANKEGISSEDRVRLRSEFDKELTFLAEKVPLSVIFSLHDDHFVYLPEPLRSDLYRMVILNRLEESRDFVLVFDFISEVDAEIFNNDLRQDFLEEFARSNPVLAEKTLENVLKSVDKRKPGDDFPGEIMTKFVEENRESLLELASRTRESFIERFEELMTEGELDKLRSGKIDLMGLFLGNETAHKRWSESLTDFFQTEFPSKIDGEVGISALKEQFEDLVFLMNVFSEARSSSKGRDLRDLITPSKKDFYQFIEEDIFWQVLMDYSSNEESNVTYANAFSIATAFFSEADRQGVDALSMSEEEKRDLLEKIIKKREQVKNYEILGPNNYLVIIAAESFKDEAEGLKKLYFNAGGKEDMIIFDNSPMVSHSTEEVVATKKGLRGLFSNVRNLPGIQDGSKSVTVVFLTHGPNIILNEGTGKEDDYLGPEEFGQILQDSGSPEAFNVLLTPCLGYDFSQANSQYVEQIEGSSSHPRVVISASNEGRVSFTSVETSLSNGDYLLNSVSEVAKNGRPVTVKEFFKAEGLKLPLQDASITVGLDPKKNIYDPGIVEERRRKYKRRILEKREGKARNVMEIGRIGNPDREIEIV